MWDNTGFLLWYKQQLYKNSVKIQKKVTAKHQETGNHHSHTLGQKQPQEMGHTASLSRKEDTWEGGREKRGKEKCSPWECSSITAGLRRALSHCHSDATSTPPERSRSTSLHCFKHKTHTHSICAFTKMQMDTFPSVALSQTSHCYCHADTNKHRYAYTSCMCDRKTLFHKSLLNKNWKLYFVPFCMGPHFLWT